MQASGPVPTETEALDRERIRMSSGSESMWVGSKRRGRRGREAPATANRHRRASKADQRTSPRRKSPWRQRSRAASGRRHRGLRAPRSASMAWALRALGLRPPSSVGQVGLQNRVPQTFVGLRNWLYYLNRWIPRRDQRPDFWDAFSRAKHDPSSFAVGGKGLASAARAANGNARKNPLWAAQRGTARDSAGQCGIARLSATQRELLSLFSLASPRGNMPRGSENPVLSRKVAGGTSRKEENGAGGRDQLRYVAAYRTPQQPATGE